MHTATHTSRPDFPMKRAHASACNCNTALGAAGLCPLKHSTPPAVSADRWPCAWRHHAAGGSGWGSSLTDVLCAVRGKAGMFALRLPGSCVDLHLEAQRSAGGGRPHVS